MLTKRDLRWTNKLLFLYSQLMWTPVAFSSEMLGEEAGQMKESSIWRRIGFKIIQILLTCHAFFMSFRTLEYMSGQGSSGTALDVKIDWDMVPIMIIFTAAYVTFEFISYFIFDAGRELNTKIYNEITKLRGKNKFFHYYKKFSTIKFLCFAFSRQ